MFDYLIVFRVGTPSFTSGEGNSIELREFFLFVFCICLSNCSSTICGKAHLFPIKLPSHLFWKSIYHTGEGLYFVPLIYISTFTPIPHILDYCSFMVAWKQEECIFQLVLLFPGKPCGLDYSHGLDYTDLCRQSKCLCFSTHCLGLSSLSCQETVVFWLHGCSHRLWWFWSQRRGDLSLLPLFPPVFAMK